MLLYFDNSHVYLLAIWLSSARKFENPRHAIAGFYLMNTLLTKLWEII